MFAGSTDEDVPDIVANLRFFADLISRDDEGLFLQNSDGWGWVSTVPIGIVGAVLPWNYPIAMLGWKVVPALAAGNAMIIKPSADSTLSALYFGDLAAEAGIPAGIITVLTGTGTNIGQAMGLHPDIDALTFTARTHLPMGRPHPRRHPGRQRIQRGDCGHLVRWSAPVGLLGGGTTVPKPSTPTGNR